MSQLAVGDRVAQDWVIRPPPLVSRFPLVEEGSAFWTFGLHQNSGLTGGYTLTGEYSLSVEVDSETGDRLIGSLLEDRAEDAPAENTDN